MKRLKTYANSRMEKLTGYLKSYQHIQDAELLHQIRVEIKKIKVLLHLICFSMKKFKGHQHFVPLRTIFRRAGEIRQLDVSYRLFLRYQIPGIAENLIPNADKLSDRSRAFQMNIPQFLHLVKLERKKLATYYQKVKKKDAKRYLKNTRDELQNLLTVQFMKAGLHKARKIAKEVIYMQKLMGNRKANTFYKEMERIIGQWHDKQQLLPVLRKSKATDEAAKLRELCKADVALLKDSIKRYYAS